MKLNQPEKKIQSNIIDYLNKIPYSFAFKVNTVGIWDPVKEIYRKLSKHVVKGTSDIIHIYRGFFLAFEVKTPERIKEHYRMRTQRDLDQAAFLNRIRQCGGIAFCVCSLDEVITIISHLDKFIHNHPKLVNINEFNGMFRKVKNNETQ